MTLDDRAKPPGIHHLLAQLAAAEDVIHIIGPQSEFLYKSRSHWSWRKRWHNGADSKGAGLDKAHF